MPLENLGRGSGRGFGNTNSKIRRDGSDLIDDITTTADVLRTANSIIVQTGSKSGAKLHLDSRELTDGAHSGCYKVELQFASGTKDTIAAAIVAQGANIFDVRTALKNSLDGGAVWKAT